MAWGAILCDLSLDTRNHQRGCDAMGGEGLHSAPSRPARAHERQDVIASVSSGVSAHSHQLNATMFNPT